MQMWDMAYKTRGEYVSALEQALEGKNVVDADMMISDIKKFFFNRNRQSIGDTEIINMLPEPETLAAQYENKEYNNRRALKKSGSAGIIKRAGIALLTLFAVVLGFLLTVGFALMFVLGVLAVIAAVIFQMGWFDSLPSQVVAVIDVLPYQAFENNPVGVIFLVASGIFLLLLSGTALKALRRLREKYHTWTLKKISGCFRLPVTLDDVYSKGWRICVYIFLPLSMIVALVTMVMLVLGVNFTF
ncbi:MAG: DUF1700 domain-containing protein [Peptococcaceae bacterium]|nr:DUF1700 domain-containing protein [Peptococcaceae bacterium]